MTEKNDAFMNPFILYYDYLNVNKDEWLLVTEPRLFNFFHLIKTVQLKG